MVNMQDFLLIFAIFLINIFSYNIVMIRHHLSLSHGFQDNRQVWLCLWRAKRNWKAGNYSIPARLRNDIWHRLLMQSERLWHPWWSHPMETFSALLAICAGHRWIPRTKASDAELWYIFLICAWINDFRCHRAHHDVTVIIKLHQYSLLFIFPHGIFLKNMYTIRILVCLVVVRYRQSPSISFIVTSLAET